MGRRKIEIAMVKDSTTRHITFFMRRPGLFKKANELSILCKAEVAIVVFSPGNNPYSFGHPSVDDVAAKFLYQGPKPNDTLDNSFSEGTNKEEFNLELADVLGQIRESEKKNEVHDEVLKQHDATELSKHKELKDSYIEFKGEMKSRLQRLEISEYLILLEKEPVVWKKAQVLKKK